jgi:hypothetical protein
MEERVIKPAQMYSWWAEDEPCARIYRPRFHENKPKTLVFT